jgi:hypothetical protein
MLDSTSFSLRSHLDFVLLVNEGEGFKSFFRTFAKEGESNTSRIFFSYPISYSLFSFSYSHSSYSNYDALSYGVVELTANKIPSLIFGTKFDVSS